MNVRTYVVYSAWTNTRRNPLQVKGLTLLRVPLDEGKSTSMREGSIGSGRTTNRRREIA